MPKAKQKAKPKTELAVTPDKKDEALYDTWARASGKDAKESDRIAFRKQLDCHPDKLRSLGDMVHLAENMLIESINVSGAVKELLRRGCDLMRKELERPLDRGLEKMLVDVAVLAWLRLGIAEQLYTTNLSGTFSDSSGKYWEKRLSHTHRRFQSACTNLARVRRLTKPPLAPTQGGLINQNGQTLFNEKFRMTMAHIFDGHSPADANSLVAEGVLPKRWVERETERLRALLPEGKV